MSDRKARIAGVISAWQGQELDPHYLGYFACFNRQDFYGAHEVLEALWLGQRQGTEERFYRGLIQLAGAFVHVQKRRLKPAAALFRLARLNLGKYPPIHQRLDLVRVVEITDDWLDRLGSAGWDRDPGRLGPLPTIALEPFS